MTKHEIIDLLFESDCSCIIAKGDDIRRFHQRGVKDLYNILNTEPEFLNGAFVADKVVGKASASLMILGDVAELYAGVISQPALDLLKGSNISVEYRQAVPHIINRTQTDWCPMEKRCFALPTPIECYTSIKDFLSQNPPTQPNNKYTLDFLSAEVATDDYVRDFRDAPRFEMLCRQCPNYGNRWGCPPLSNDVCNEYLSFPRLKIIAVKITPVASGLPLSSSYDFLNDVRRSVEPQLLEQERITDGRAALFTGMCFHCNDCARKLGQPCRHPELVRPSLEALGFDLDATARRLLNTEILWSKDGKLPPYLLLIGGLFYK